MEIGHFAILFPPAIELSRAVALADTTKQAAEKRKPTSHPVSFQKKTANLKNGAPKTAELRPTFEEFPC